MIATNIVLDYLFTQVHNSKFYFSESLLFSSFWFLFFPLILVLSKLTKKKDKIGFTLIITSSLVVIHILGYPALVWVLSKVFYYHTFSYLQTLNYCLSAYFLKSVIIYGFTFILLTVIRNRTEQKLMTVEEEVEVEENLNFITSIVISDSNNNKIVLAVNDVFYFSANSPYINIHHFSKKYLHSETLKNLENQLDNNQFVRIHKSHILNIDKVVSFLSRQNGDYEVSLSDNSTLRVSRRYAREFKSKLKEHHRVTIK